MFDAAAGGYSYQDRQGPIPTAGSLAKKILPWIPENTVLHNLVCPPMTASS
ncbi:unnamed protein product [marine sediment metagenome]|uniref:Uncharacterized protein n=1 Tax=marine sediment metagenome TaxID=412755 RepID=X0Y4G1_9ZZZZ